MKKSEAAEALGFCAAFDQRTVGTTDITAWSLALSDLPWDESTMQAIADFYSAPASDYDRDSRRFIQPHHVRSGRSRIRQRRIECFEKDAAYPIPNEVEGVQCGQELRALRRAIADGLITTKRDAENYRQWGGSLHLAYKSSDRPAIVPRPDAPALHSRPVDPAIEGTFKAPPRADLRRALTATSQRRAEMPKWVRVPCPVCDVPAGDLCVIPESAPPVKRPDPHTRRLRAAHTPTIGEASE